MTTRTCRVRASAARRRPTATPAMPPIPASTSSKTSVGTASRSARTLRHASIVRESSPPEATFASGTAAWPATPPTAGSPPVPRRSPMPAPLEQLDRRPWRRACRGHAAPPRTRRASLGAPPRRGRLRPRPSARPRAVRAPRRRPPAATRDSSDRARSSSGARASSRNARTSSSSSPYWRRRPRTAARRSSDLRRAGPGSSSSGSRYVTDVAGELDRPTPRSNARPRRGRPPPGRGPRPPELRRGRASGRAPAPSSTSSDRSAAVERSSSRSAWASLPSSVVELGELTRARRDALDLADLVREQVGLPLTVPLASLAARRELARGTEASRAPR